MTSKFNKHSERPTNIQYINHTSETALAARNALDASEFDRYSDGLEVDAPGFRLRIVNDAKSRQQANALVQEAYLKKGYVPETPPQRTPHPIRPSRLVTILAQGMDGEALGTVSLSLDGLNGLPCDVTFKDDCHFLRTAGRQIAEVTRLALARSHRRSMFMMARMFNLLYICARHIHACDDFLVEVHPRHTQFYMKKLGFTLLGNERPCLRVRGAPAVLLRLNLNIPDRMIRDLASQNNNGLKASRTLYPFFIPPTKEAHAIRRLKHLQSQSLQAEFPRYES